MPTRVLVFDPSRRELDVLTDRIRQACGDGGRIRSVGQLADLDRELAADSWDLLVLDLALGDGTRDGLEVLMEVRARDDELPIVVVAARGDVDSAQRAIDAGANDFLVRGDRLGERVATQLEKIRRVLRLIEEKRTLLRENGAHRDALASRYSIVTRSASMEALLARAQKVAPVPRPILIVGERGTGKELLAHLVHAASGRRGPFVAVNCAAFAEPLLESELFGHERGAYTGADRRVPGKFELAAGGTLFLDEIGNTSIGFQRKILRVVEYGTFSRVGSHTESQSDARIVAATNADLDVAMKDGTFLPDLYDRLAFEVLRIPPLRDRPDDIDALAAHFLERFVVEVPAFRHHVLSAAALTALKAHRFPGNVRELKNVIERAIYRDEGLEITPDHLDLGAPAHRTQVAEGFSDQIAALEHELLERALAQAGGNRAEAARRLGLTYDQLRHYTKKHGLDG